MSISQVASKRGSKRAWQKPDERRVMLTDFVRSVKELESDQTVWPTTRSRNRLRFCHEWHIGDGIVLMREGSSHRFPSHLTPHEVFDVLDAVMRNAGISHWTKVKLPV